jgi:hypothetical protein
VCLSRVCPGSPGVFLPGVRVLLVGLDGCEVRLCVVRVPLVVELCVRAWRVPCVPCVSRLPPVSFYRESACPVRVPAPPGVFLPGPGATGTGTQVVKSLYPEPGTMYNVTRI